MPNANRQDTPPQELGTPMEDTTFDAVFKEYRNVVYSIALRFMGNRDDALEVAQESFIRIYKGLPNFRGESKLSTWIYRITVNQALSQSRGKRKFVELPDIPDEQVYFGGIANALETLGMEDRKNYLAKAMLELNADENTILMLYYTEEQSVDEIASIMRLTPSNVKVRLFRGRNKLHQKLHKMLNSEVNNLL
jgi:RNA polymerase sigma-70 factor (ECF subfamily)